VAEALIEVENRPELGRYQIYADGKLVGHAVYRIDGSEVAIVHTEIEPSVEGHGLGTRLVEAALDDIRAAGRSVAPFCPFVRSFIATHPEYLDLVAPSRRAEFRLPSAP
jgi:predicted GNAT family acetyltransferase